MLLIARSAFLIVLAFFIVAIESHQHNQHQHVMAGSASKNVLKTPLSLFSTNPLTGYMRNGYCEVPPSDYGNHSVAAELSEEFLDYTAKQGNDLRIIPGMKGGCKWCLCASRWREAFDARKNDSDPMVPKIFLNATHEKALDKVSLDELKKFAKD